MIRNYQIGVIISIFFLIFISCKKEQTNIVKPHNNFFKDSLFVDSINKNFYKIYSNNSPQALKDIKLTITLCDTINNNRLKAIALKNYGIVTYLSGDYKEAQKAYLESYSLLKGTNFKANLADLCNEMGHFYSKQEDSIRAFQKWNEAEKLSKQSGEATLLGTTYTMKAYYYHKHKFYSQADSLFKKCYEIRLQEKDSVGLGFVLLDIADMERRSGNFEKAKALLEQSKLIREKINDNFYLLETEKSLADLYLSQKAYDLAINTYKKVIKEGENQNYIDLSRKCYDSLYVIFSKLGNYNLALNNKLKSQNIKDSLFNISKAKSIVEFQTKYETTEKERKILQIQNEKAETELELSKKTVWIYSLIGGVLVLVFIGLALIQRNKRKHEREKFIAIVNEKESGMLALIEAEEKERSRIAKELHDGIVQDIGSVILGWRDNVTDAKSKKLLLRLENTNNELRQVSHQLMPKTLSELGLISALIDMLEHSLTVAKIAYRFDHFNINKRLENTLEVTVYRIAQELIQNIIKHSQANKVEIQLFINIKNLLLIVEDNGIGMQYNQNSGIGLQNIKSRLLPLNGVVNFEQINNSGTLVTIKIPL